MYLKSLEIIGFKSFANKTVVKFSSGITGIVGPNGCGKTNILDALRWVLGEQRISLLRGSKMEEVIFSGTREMKPLGMAEVTLTLVNDRGVLPIEYTELQITRRLFRSGESEYLLNKVPCRLKDITELFFDTGLGAHSYSVIQQDMIDSVISDKAEERRFLFEEAAGITKYKQRKKAALRKLESTENDLLRLRDIYSEVKTQVNSLKRQYKKAERYQLIRDNIKNWELYLSSTRVAGVEDEKRQLKGKAESHSDQIIGKEAEIDIASATLENIRKEQVDLEHGINVIGGEVYEITEAAHELETEISVLKEKIHNGTTLIERDRNDIEALTKRGEILNEQTDQAQLELTQAQTGLKDVNERQVTAETAQATADQKLLDSRAGRENENQKLLELEGKLSSGMTEDENFRQQLTELDKQLSSLQAQIEDNLSGQKNLVTSRDQAQQELDNTKSNKSAAEQSRVKLNSLLEQMIEEGNELSDGIANHSASIEACEARKNILEDMILHFEGHQSGTVAVMEVKDRWSGIAGVVAEKFVPVEGMEIALEAALAEISGFLICNDRATAEAVIKFLRSEKKGKIGILVPDSGTINPVIKRPELEDPGFVGWLDDFVSTDNKLKPLMQAVLARIAVFKAGNSPMNILEHLPVGFKAVSTDGQVYAKNFIGGGSDDAFPLFRRKEKVAEQETMLKELHIKLESIQQKKNALQAGMASSRAESAELTETIDTLSEELAVQQKRYDEISFDLRTLATDAARFERERLTCRGKSESLRNLQCSLELDFSQLATQKESLVTSMSLSSDELNSLEQEAVNALETLSRLQVKAVEARSNMERIETMIVHQRELQEDIRQTISAKRTEIENADFEITNAARQTETLEKSLKITFDKRVGVSDRQNQLKGRQSEIMEQISDREKVNKVLRREKEELSEGLHKLEIRLTTIDSEINATVERTLEEYELDIRTVDIARPDEDLSDEQAIAQLAEMKEKLKAFGAVNLLALEEFKTADERERFLGEHIEDLTTAKKDLEATIARVNKTAKELFVKTFEQVQINFSELFIELFSGGEASLHLQDPANPLESNIEIVARPRGKKLLPITMMSGGERALTAISLLFSLYLVKPSPYCILDEIDAPLDDANCHRFLKIIRKFSKQTQFVTITHNKITMAAANNLYGVTMEQPGISKLVGVKFTEEDQSQRVDLDMSGDVEETLDSIEEKLESGNVDAKSVREASGSREESGEAVDLPQAVIERLTPSIKTGDPSADN